MAVVPKITVNPSTFTLGENARTRITASLTQPIICQPDPILPCSVVLDFAASVPSGVVLDSPSVEWTSAQWAQSRTFNVSIADPDLLQNNQVFQLAAIASSRSMYYSGFSVAISVTVAVTRTSTTPATTTTSTTTPSNTTSMTTTPADATLTPTTLTTTTLTNLTVASTKTQPSTTIRRSPSTVAGSKIDGSATATATTTTVMNLQTSLPVATTTASLVSGQTSNDRGSWIFVILALAAFIATVALTLRHKLRPLKPPRL